MRANLPDIRSIVNLREIESLSGLSSIDQNKVKEYMERGNVKTLKRLQSIHRFATTLWATTIYDASNEP
ncbi:MAG: hypothetical protein JNM27_13755 [Leptospirales bacterium]|nr:hypothetical protein [Leptospirales bacterium]